MTCVANVSAVHTLADGWRVEDRDRSRPACNHRGPRVVDGGYTNRQTDSVRRETFFDEFFDGNIQCMGFTAQDCEQLFPCIGQFNDHWNVWSELRDLIDINDLLILTTDAHEF